MSVERQRAPLIFKEVVQVAGRPSKYDTHIKPYFDQIKKWAEQGATERQIAKQLGVAYSTFCDYKTKYPELSELLKGKDMGQLVEELRSALVKRALGYEYKESKSYYRIPKSAITDGQIIDRSAVECIYKEETQRHQPPDTTAIFGALNIYDPEYVRDKKNHELREKDYELRRAIAEANNFDLDIK